MSSRRPYQVRCRGRQPRALGLFGGWPVVLLPALCLASDLAEDTLLARALSAPETMTIDSVAVLHAPTRVKIWAVALSAIQTGLLFVAALVWPRRRDRAAAA